MNQSTKHEINNKLQLIIAYGSKLPPEKKHALEAAVWDIKSLINETPLEKTLREFYEMLELKETI